MIYHVEIEPGTSIDMAATELCYAARLYGHATMTFNDIPFKATKDTHASDVLAEWGEINAARARACEEAKKREQEELRLLREFIGFVESWVSNPVGAYSVSALDSLFAMTRDRIAAVAAQTSAHRKDEP